MCDVEFIKTAINNAAKGKRSRPYIAKILKNIDYYAASLKQRLESGSVELSPNSHCNLR